MTARAFVERVAAAAGPPARLSGTPLALIRLVGLVNPMAREIPDIWDQYTRPWTVDDRRFRETFGPGRITAVADGVAETLEWFRARAAA